MIIRLREKNKKGINLFDLSFERGNRYATEKKISGNKYSYNIHSLVHNGEFLSSDEIN